MSPKRKAKNDAVAAKVALRRENGVDLSKRLTRRAVRHHTAEQEQTLKERRKKLREGKLPPGRSAPVTQRTAKEQALMNRTRIPLARGF